MTHKILFRVDSGKTIGSGHAMRSMALAKQLQRDGADVVLIGAGLKKAQHSARSFSSLGIHDSNFDTLDDEMSAVTKWSPDLVIFDGYHFQAELFERIGSLGALIGVIDDNGETKATQAAFVINQNPAAHRNLYPSHWTKTRFFLGLDYVLLRDEFTEEKPSIRQTSEENILVAIGGTDSLGIAPKIVGALMTLNLKVSAPKSQINLKQIEGPISPSRQLATFRPHAYPTHLGNASLAILGGGSSLYEAIHCHVPSIAAVVADNQINIVRSLVDLELIAGYVDFRQQSLQDGTIKLLDFCRKWNTPSPKRQLAALNPGFGSGKVVLSHEIRSILPSH